MGVHTNAMQNSQIKRTTTWQKCDYTKVSISQQKHYYHASNMEHLHAPSNGGGKFFRTD